MAGVQKVGEIMRKWTRTRQRGEAMLVGEEEESDGTGRLKLKTAHELCDEFQ